MAVIDIEYGKAILEDQYGETVEGSDKQSAQEWEMILHNSSYGHEYARLELEEAKDMISQEDLLEKMDNYKRAYFMARRYLKRENPEALKRIETDLIDQKVRIFGVYTA
ncbi:MAG: hypothetical protein K8R69_06325 [Deltaproteobacteria bacterium]|nr:hypothetical protein [Deltaproteobacteria bacterium]